ncbi:hypothetical protein [Microbacterium xylanilyticum]
MPSRPLAPDTALCVRLSATMHRNQYTQEPGPVVAELYEIAGNRIDLLAAEVGRWVGFYEDQHTITLTTALRALPLDMDDAIKIGEHRRNLHTHSTSGFGAPPGLAEVH